MKKVILLLPLIILLSNVNAQNEKSKIEASVIGLFNGLSLLNADTMKYYTTQDFHLLENGKVWTIDTLINKVTLRKNANFKRVNKLEFIRTEQKGNTSWVSYNNTADFTIGEKQRTVKWLESAVLVKENERWKIQMLHSTKLN